MWFCAYLAIQPPPGRRRLATLHLHILLLLKAGHAAIAHGVDGGEQQEERGQKGDIVNSVFAHEGCACVCANGWCDV